MLMALALSTALQSAEPPRLPIAAYGDDEWSVKVDRDGFVYRLGDSWSPVTRQFGRVRVTRRGSSTIISSRTAAGKPVTLTIEPGECRTNGDNQTALRARLEVDGRTHTGCAEEGTAPTITLGKPFFLGDYPVELGVEASGANGEWRLRVGSIGTDWFQREDDMLEAVDGPAEPRVSRGVATYQIKGEDGRRVTAAVRLAQCTLSDGSQHPFTVEVQAGRETFKGCGWQGTLPRPMMMASDGGSDAKLLSGAISNDLDYPHQAQRARATGAVTVTYMVGVDGRVTSCSVAESSGHASLDATTCHLLRARFRFAPARDSGGRPREAERSFRMVWRLPAA
jgi:protein TonB